MKRRRNHSNVNIPERLRVFRWLEWGATTLEARHRWTRARIEHSNQHPEHWPDPFAPLAGAANVRAKLAGRRPPWPTYDQAQPGFDD